MIIPNLIQEKVVDENGYLTTPWQMLFQSLLQNMQQNLGNEGLVVPSQPLTKIQQIASGTNLNGDLIALGGTLLFASDEINGGSAAKPNGQLKIILQNGVVRTIQDV